MKARRVAAARSGFRDVLPILAAEVPFGLVVGVTAAELGMNAAEALAVSTVVFTGAAQLAGFELVGDGAPALVVVATMLVVNLRYVMYSASIATYFRRYGRATRWLFAYLLTDPTYALAVTEFRDRQRGDARRWYYLGTAVPLWAAFQAGTLAGAVFGARLSPRWHLDFAVPLLFVALLFPTLEDRPTVAAAVVAGGIAVAGAGLPMQSGFVLAAVGGVAAGLAAERRTSRGSPA